ncbi:Dual specificity protein phosphatase 7, partial [Fragariocoptes setiger]
HCKARSHSNKKDQQSSSSSSSLKIRAKCVNVNDTHDQRLDAFFDECLTFIDEALASKSNILIHCKAGISRSPTVAIAYMIRAHQCSLALAYHHVKCRRQQISPNLNFMGQLYAYEQQLSKVRANPNATAPITVGGGIASAHQQQQAQQPAMRSPVLSPSTVAQRTPS